MTQAGLSEQQRLIVALRDPAVYPHATKSVRIIETHISWIVLAGRYAYKIKKALDLGFLDTRTLASRHHDCTEELRLNRRLAPKLYLDVVPVGGSATHPQLGMEPAIEYAVRMRRFASGKTLDRLVTRGKVDAEYMDTLACTLARFHSELAPLNKDHNNDYAANVQQALTQNYTQLAGLLHDTNAVTSLNDLQQTSAQILRALYPRITLRQQQGRVRECHGDLHLGNIALIGTTPTPFDAIDFNSALRRIDVMDEVAFLFMDLLHHDLAQLAYRFLNAYLEISGDYAGVEVLRFYTAYRATVRAKVNAIRAQQIALTPVQQRRAMMACHAYLATARTSLAAQSPALLITHGLPGSGKSSFAQFVVQRIGAIRLRSDVERKRLFGLTALADSRAGKHDIYSAAATHATYTRLLDDARTVLRAGFTVIVDAAFLKHDERVNFQRLAQEMHIPFIIVSLCADDATLRDRIMQRQKQGNDASEADLAVLEKLRGVQEELSTQEQSYALTLNGAQDETAWHALKARLSLHP